MSETSGTRHSGSTRQQSLLRRILTFAAGYLFISVLITAPYFIPPVPRTPLGWLLLFLVAPPLYFAGEWAMENSHVPGWGAHCS